MSFGKTRSKKIDRFIILIKIEDFYGEMGKGVKKRFGTSNYEVKRPLPMGEKKKLQV